MLDFEFFLFAPIKQIQLNQRTNEKNIKLTEVFAQTSYFQTLSAIFTLFESRQRWQQKQTNKKQVVQSWLTRPRGGK